MKELEDEVATLRGSTTPVVVPHPNLIKLIERNLDFILQTNVKIETLADRMSDVEVRVQKLESKQENLNETIVERFTRLAQSRRTEGYRADFKMESFSFGISQLEQDVLEMKNAMRGMGVDVEIRDNNTDSDEGTSEYGTSEEPTKDARDNLRRMSI